MKKRILSTLLALCMALVLLPVTALAADSDFVIEDGILTSYTGPGGVVTIPDGVTEIQYTAFAHCSTLTSVVIPNGVTRIGMAAFGDCPNLTSVTIPASVTYIGESAFDICDSLKDVYYSGSESQWEQVFISPANFGNLPLLNASIHYNSAAPSVPATPAVKAVLSPQKLAVDGKNIDCEKYNIDGSNYFKLRDLAYALNGTGSQFGVGYDEATSTVTITTGADYTPAGGELATGVDNSASAQPSSQAILINGEKNDKLTVYNIGGSNFFQLRELGSLLGFEVDFDQDTNTAIVRSNYEQQLQRNNNSQNQETPSTSGIGTPMEDVLAANPGAYVDENGTLHLPHLNEYKSVKLE